MKECLFEKYGFEKDKRVELIDSYNHAVLGRVLVKDSTLMHNATIKSFAWVIWDLQGKFINSLGSDNHSLIKFNLKKLDNSKTYKENILIEDTKQEPKMDSESKKNTNHGMKYVKTIYATKGYVIANIYEKRESTLNLMGHKWGNDRLISTKEFGNTLLNAYFERNSKKVQELLDDANLWADEYIGRIKNREHEKGKSFAEVK